MHARGTLDICLGPAGVLSEYPQTVGLDIQIDVLLFLGRINKIDRIEDGVKNPVNLVCSYCSGNEIC